MTLLENLKKSVKRGAGREQFLAPTLLSLVAITLGADSETFFKEISPIYSELISKGLTNDQNFASVKFLRRTVESYSLFFFGVRLLMDWESCVL